MSEAGQAAAAAEGAEGAEGDDAGQEVVTYEQSKAAALTDFLDSILKHPSSGLTPKSLHALSDDHLLQYSLLILALLGKTSAEDETSSVLLDKPKLLDAFVSRISTNRVLKLRVALLLGLGKMKHLWDPQLKYESNCHATAAAKSKEEDLSIWEVPPLKAISATKLLEEDSATSTAFADYVTHRFFHPTHGIQLKAKKRNLGLRTIERAFSKQYAILWLMQDLNIDKTIAQQLFEKMETQELIRLAMKGTKEGKATASGFGNAVYQPGKLLFEQTDVSDITCSSFLTSTDGDGYTSATPLFGDGRAIRITLPMDGLDMQSLKFWRDAIWEKSPLTEGYQFDASTVVHPMIATSGDELVHAVTVQKIFSSMAKPAFLKLSAYQEGAVIEGPLTEEEDDTTPMEALREIPPRVIAKNGDNLINDASVELLFRIFSHVWQSDLGGGGGDADKAAAPFAFDYDVLPCGPRVGLLGVLSGLEPLNDFDWKTWATKYADDAEVKIRMCRSAAGCSIATFVLGCGDRHWDNIQIADNATMLHIDFGMILGENPAFKTPRFSISAGQEAAFKQVGIWEQFVELSAKAFLSLRAHAPALMNLTALVLQHAGRPQSRILKYLASRESFNVQEDDDTKAAQLVTQQIRDSSTHWETIARKFTHDRIDPLFFKAAEAAPASLVAAVERMYDKT